MPGVSPGNRWELAVVGVPASSKIADSPEESVPEKDVDQEVAGEGDSCPKSGPASHDSAWRVEGGNEVGSRRGEEVGDSAQQRTVREIDFRFAQKDRGNHSQDKGPKNLRFNHRGGTLNEEFEASWAARLNLANIEQSEGERKAAALQSRVA